MTPDQPQPTSASALPQLDGDAVVVSVDPDVDITEDLTCIRCQYNLRGLHGDGRCPECGLTVLATLRRNVVLGQTDLRWLEKLRRGAYLLAASMVVWAVGPFVVLQTDLRGYEVAPFVLTGPRIWSLPFAFGMRMMGTIDVLMLPGLAALMLYVVGIWHVAAQEPALKHVERGMTARKWLLALALTLPLVTSIWWSEQDARGSLARGTFQRNSWPFWAWAFAMLDVVVHVLLFAHLRRLASRVLDAALVRETRLLAGAQTTALTCVAVGCLLAGVHGDFVVLAAISCCVLSLAGIGVVILMFAFVRAFGESAISARAGEQTPYALVAAAGADEAARALGAVRPAAEQ